MSTGIDCVNEPSSEPSDTTGLPVRPSRDRRRPARYLSTVRVSDAAADVGKGHRHLGNFVELVNKSLSCEEVRTV